MANPLISMLGLGATQPNQPNSNPMPAQPSNGIMGNLNTVLGLYNLAKNSGNPVETINQMAQNNPNVADTIRYINQNGGDMNAIANDLAQKAGVSLPLITGLFK